MGVITAPSNIAVDNMLEKLLNVGLRVVRLGYPARRWSRCGTPHPGPSWMSTRSEGHTHYGGRSENDSFKRFCQRDRLTPEEDRAMKGRSRLFGKSMSPWRNPFQTDH